MNLVEEVIKRIIKPSNDALEKSLDLIETQQAVIDELRKEIAELKRAK